MIVKGVMQRHLITVDHLVVTVLNCIDPQILYYFKKKKGLNY